MPFTLSHPAFAVPVRRLLPGKLALLGVVLGSMAPDLEYFVRMVAVGRIGHQLSGFILIGLPLCIALCCAYLFVVRPALSSFMPRAFGFRDYVHERTSRSSPVAVLDWMSFLLAAFAGFGTHLFMDAWTHRSGWFVQRIEALQRLVMGDYVFHWLQYLTSVAGAAVIVAWLILDWMRWRRGANKSAGGRSDNRLRRANGVDYAFFARWAAASMIGLLVLLVKLNSLWSPFQLYVLTVAPFSAAAVGIYAASILIMTNRAQQWSFGLSAVALMLSSFWALKLGILAFAALRIGIELTTNERWIGSIWILCIIIIIISVQINRIVKEFVRIGLKTVNNRTLS